jgi:hypothetical protein
MHSFDEGWCTKEENWLDRIENSLNSIPETAAELKIMVERNWGANDLIPEEYRLQRTPHECASAR